MYPEELVAPMRADLTNNGFVELRDKSQVVNTLPSAKGTSLLVVNSVCGCAAGSARPGAIGSLNGEKKNQIIFLRYLQDKILLQLPQQENFFYHTLRAVQVLVFLKMVSLFIS